MYELSVHTDLIAQHYLTIPDCGPENEWHSHHFKLEIQLSGPALNEDGYLIDIVAVENHLDELVDRYQDSTLNDLPEFEDLNPSIEHFARILCESVRDALDTSHLNELTVRIWEDEHAWASYSSSL